MTPTGNNNGRRATAVLSLLLLISSGDAGGDGAAAGQLRMFYVVEELPPNSFVCNLVTELDLEATYDRTILDRLRFSFFTQPPFDRQYFQLDERTGVIKTSRRIDRERLCPSPSDAVECLAEFDVAIRPLEYFQIVKVAIEILDVNDHAPQFPTRRIQHRLAESADPKSSGIVLPSAVDPDAGRNGVRKYEIVSSASDKFLLEARETADGGTDLRLLLREKLDRESEDRYTAASRS